MEEVRQGEALVDVDAAVWPQSWYMLDDVPLNPDLAPLAIRASAVTKNYA